MSDEAHAVTAKQLVDLKAYADAKDIELAASRAGADRQLALIRTVRGTLAMADGVPFDIAAQRVAEQIAALKAEVERLTQDNVMLRERIAVGVGIIDRVFKAK